jgi:hypothetical protein
MSFGFHKAGMLELIGYLKTYQNDIKKHLQRLINFFKSFIGSLISN